MDGKYSQLCQEEKWTCARYTCLKNEKWLFEEGGQLLTTLL